MARSRDFDADERLAGPIQRDMSDVDVESATIMTTHQTNNISHDGINILHAYQLKAAVNGISAICISMIRALFKEH